MEETKCEVSFKMKVWIVLQVASATSTFAMVFSSSMSVVQYYLLKRFPVPYGKQQFTKKEKRKL